MSDHMREALGKVLDEHDARRRGDVEREQKGKDEAELFVTQFVELRRAVVRPVFESAAALLAERGHKSSISEQEFATDSSGKVTEAGISLHVVAAGMRSSLKAHARSLSITTRHYDKKIWFDAGASMNDGGIAGSKGAYPVERIDRKLVEEQLVKFVTGIVAD